MPRSEVSAPTASSQSSPLIGGRPVPGAPWGIAAGVLAALELAVLAATLGLTELGLAVGITELGLAVGRTVLTATFVVAARGEVAVVVLDVVWTL
ncbi:MAG: hypothetical protein ACRD6W_08825 [Nitrososphaerales archaeon]